MDHGNISMQYFNCKLSFFTCIVLSITYVASLYVWNSQHNRDHPSTIRRRFFSVFIMMFVSPAFLYVALSNESLEKASLLHLLGIRQAGVVQAAMIPLVLTVILFLGPVCMQLFNRAPKIVSEPVSSQIGSLIWWRNHVVAPVSEEFTFRACMMPALLQCFRPISAVFICPLFFGIAHFHHFIERIRNGMDYKTVLFISCFQCFYTTIFGAYSAYLFYRTGHIISAFVVHAFCNHMGFPDFVELTTYEKKKRNAIVTMFFTGFIAWCYLIVPMTEPSLYHNYINWED